MSIFFNVFEKFVFSSIESITTSDIYFLAQTYVPGACFIPGVIEHRTHVWCYDNSTEDTTSELSEEDVELIRRQRQLAPGITTFYFAVNQPCTKEVFIQNKL